MASYATYESPLPDSVLEPRKGQVVEILRTITEPEDGFDAEVLPMHKVRFPDGLETELWPDEITGLHN